MRVRNFWFKHHTGYYLPNNEFVQERTIQGGSPRIMGGFKAEYFQRTCGEPHGAQLVVTGEARAEPSGKLVFRLFDPKGNVIWRSDSHRDGKI
jgi:hypothetical protein